MIDRASAEDLAIRSSFSLRLSYKLNLVTGAQWLSAPSAISYEYEFELLRPRSTRLVLRQPMWVTHTIS